MADNAPTAAPKGRVMTLQKVLTWDVPAIKVQIANYSPAFKAHVLWLELSSKRPRKRLVKWLCEHIASLI